ncbi:MAG: type VII secretion protein EccCa [Ornithinimicrobium sp.]
MSEVIVHRAARATPGSPTVDTVRVERPPTLPEANPGLGGLLMLVPMLGAGASMTVMMLFRGSSLAAVGALMMILTILASVVMVFSQRGKAARSRRGQRELYFAYLERLRGRMADAERDSLTLLRHAQPHPRALLSIVVQGPRLWERRRADTDFMQVRLGIGPVAMHDFARQGEDPGVREVDAFMQAELERVERRFRHACEGPVVLDLNAVGDVSVLGDRSFCDRVARIILAQASTFVSPADLHLALALRSERATAWSGSLWLPHLIDNAAAFSGAQGPPRRVAPTAADLRSLLGPEIQRRIDLAQRHTSTRPGAGAFPCLVAIMDEHGEPSSELLPPLAEVGPAAVGMTVVHLVAHASDEPSDVSVRIRQDGAGSSGAVLEVYERRDEPPSARKVSLDDWEPAELSAVSRSLSGLRLSPDSMAEGEGDQQWDVGRMLGLDDPSALDLDRAWAPRPSSAFLRVPIGIDDAGEPLMLDLKESAQSGMGPHGLCVGATGSGKSELLRTLVLALLSTHSPEDVAMVLVDYKGGATFAPFASAPHVHGVITNLGDDATLVERVYASLAGEVRRRQQMLKDAGNLADITAYRKQRAHRPDPGEDVPPMPHLLVIIDEFGELLSARPDFIELFLSMGRIGRSIGVHLLLSSQRIESGKLRGLDTYLSYRLGLRTLSESESRTVLDTPDAFALPALPGFGYLKVDTATYSRFRAGYVSGPITSAREAASPTTPEVTLLSHYPHDADPASGVPVGRSEGGPAEPSEADGPDGPTVLSETVARLAARERVGPAVWSDPLPDRISLDRVYAAGVVETALGTRIPHSAALRIPIGVLDDPARQWQGPWEVDLGDSTSHMLIVGGPRSGRSTLLRTIAASLSLTHNASDVIAYGVDALGSNLQALAGLPIMAGVAGRMESEVTRRIIDEVHATLTEREEIFTHLRVDSLARAREVVAGRAVNGPLPNLADIMLLIDGYGPLAEEHEAAHSVLQAVIRRGPAYGIRVVATASRWNEVRLGQQTFFGTVIEMRLGDPAESGVDRKRAQTLTSAGPGRCLLQSGLFAQVALPRIDSGTDESTNCAAVTAMVQRVSAAAPHRARPVKVLPASLSASDLGLLGTGAPVSPAGSVPLGLDEKTFGAATLDLDGADRNLLIVGDSGTGRTGILRHLAQMLVRASTPEDLVVAVIDPRHTMRDHIPADYVGAYAGSPTMAAQLVEAILPELDERASRLADAAGSFTPPAPRIVVIVDDYDVLTATGSSPLAPLVPYISMGRELNLNVLLARRTNGASRGIFEPTFAALRDSGATGLLLSGDRSEGQLFGTVRPMGMPTGRGQLVRAGQAARTVQTVHAPAAPTLV